MSDITCKTYFTFSLFLPGSESVKTITKVSVKMGASVSIPCSYDLKYKDHVKYLCKGFYWNSCSYEVRTDSPRETGKYSISDDKTQRIYTVTIKQLTADTYYWCIVEINNGADDGQLFQLSVTKGKPILWVADQNVTGYIGDNININFYYATSGGIQWCKLGRTCVTQETGKIDGTAVTINKAADNVFSVTMSGLKQKDSGWYYCVRGDFQMPVHLTVTVKPTAATTTVAATTTIAATTTVTGARDNTTTGHKGNSPFPALMSLAIPLSVLIFIVIAALSILFVLRRTKRVRIKDSTASKNEGDLTYSEVSFKKNKAAQAASDTDMTYSSVVPVKKQNVRMSEGKDEDVTYSTIIHHKQKV
ncbi:CMRF35-like molecule 1 isoform X4 [Xiphophorus hellerii]|uniref:CMRF35-like molecule 1 isoform X4 n=1 Tax=Xiphophorus hellerii TaxID=8084 RepID=UPI0013B3A6AC|nr:CMRF35-like molecule 1 isoform X4 [Xiphophorus hellerii]